MASVFEQLVRKRFDLRFTYHADAILRQDFREAVKELDRIIGSIDIPIDELVRSGGGEAQVTQRLRGTLTGSGWRKGIFRVEKKINDNTTFAQSHEVDHVKGFPNGDIALEIEWNNKDPFFDRDLENFNRLHADGAISVGMIVTRGASLQDGLLEKLKAFAARRRFSSSEDLAEFGLAPTTRQRRAVERYLERNNCTFAEAWAVCFFRDKFGTATTHWSKLRARFDRGVGSPCPIVGIGIPLSCISS